MLAIHAQVYIELIFLLLITNENSKVFTNYYRSTLMYQKDRVL